MRDAKKCLTVSFVSFAPTAQMSRPARRALSAGFAYQGLIPRFEDGHEGFLGDIDAADALHALLAFFLLLEQLAFAGDVAAVAFGGDVFADRFDGFASDDLSADRGLQGNLKQMAIDFFLQSHQQLTAARLGMIAMDDDAEGIDAIAVDENIHLHQLAGAEA